MVGEGQIIDQNKINDSASKDIGSGAKEGENEEDQGPKIAPEVDPLHPLPIVVDVIIVNMDRVLFEGRAKSLIVPVPYGNLAILPGHTPLFTKLTKGTISVTPEYGNAKTFDIDSGIAKITQFKATLLIGFLGK